MYALIANVGVAGAGNGATTAPIDTTGANLLVALVFSWVAAAAPGFADSKSNSWTGLTVRSAADPEVRLFYVQGGAVGTGHTFSTSGTATYSGCLVAAFSGSVASPADQENGATGSGVTSLKPGSITPTEDNELVIAAMATNNNAGFSTQAAIDGGFTFSNRINSGGDSYAAALAYLIQTSAAAADPTFSWNNAHSAAAVIASFKAAAAGGGSLPPFVSARPRFLSRRRYV